MAVVYCAGPHIEPVPLYSVDYTIGITRPIPHNVLCAACDAVYVLAVTAPSMIQAIDGDGKPQTMSDGSPLMTANLDHSPSGCIPSAFIIERRNKAKDPNWTPPPHNYHEPK